MQRRLKGGSQEIHRKPKEDSKENQRRLTREPKEAHKRFKRGSKESKRSSKEAARKLKGGPRKIKRRPKEGWEEIQTRLKGGPKRPTESTKKTIRRKRAGLWTGRWDAENNWRKIRSGVGQVPGSEIEFPMLVPKVQPSNCKFIMFSTMALKKQILAV